MQSQGLGDEEIGENLRQQGFSPKEVNDAFSQLRIREAVSQEYSDVESPQPPQPGAETQSGAYQEYSYPQQQYTSGVSSDTVAELVDQAVSEKMSALNKSISSLASLKSSFEGQLKEMDTRIKKLEENMETLQRAVIGKIGDYGKDIKNIHSEMSAMQEGFSKMLNPLTDNIRKLERIGGKSREKRAQNEMADEDASETEEASSQEKRNSKEQGDAEEESDSGDDRLAREHFNFDLLKKIGKGKE